MKVTQIRRTSTEIQMDVETNSGLKIQNSIRLPLRGRIKLPSATTTTATTTIRISLEALDDIIKYLNEGLK